MSSPDVQIGVVGAGSCTAGEYAAAEAIGRLIAGLPLMLKGKV